MEKPPRWLRASGWAIGVTVEATLWGVGLALLLTGIVLWRSWHALARGGQGGTGQITHCEWESVGGGKRHSNSSGYYSCTYTYRTVPDGTLYGGYFQSPRQWEDGQPIPILYLPDRPEISAATENVRHPSIAPGAMIALGGGWMGWLAWQAWKRRAGTRPRG
jgi:hypothetical protein